MSWMFLAVIFGACEDTSTEKEITEVNEDRDGDGFVEGEDCNDDDASIFPGSAEICDGIDNNCDDSIDEDVTSNFYADSDGDGFGNPNITIEACSEPTGFVNNGSDCDDTENNAFPGGDEICDGKDNDCNGDIDDGIDAEFYVDADGDGFGDDSIPMVGCALDLGLSTLGGDCDDGNIYIHPLIDETCDNIDNNCDGNIDENVLIAFYFDADEDGYGDTNTSISACEQPLDYIQQSGDCDDADTFVFPGAPEFCDGKDNNCDGATDEGETPDALTWYEDGDEDGFGDPNSTLLACIQPNGYVENSSDCNDNQQSVHPNAAEYCNGSDDNCDGNIDEQGASDALTWYEDGDEDGFGDPNSILLACTQVTGYVGNSDDCNDNDEDIYLHATERCNSKDDDCDGNTDESDAIDASTWYEDTDEDGFGGPNTLISCDMPSGFSVNSDDCDDGNIDISPNGTETCNQIDDNCDGNIDDASATNATLWYEDSDHDGFGVSSTTQMACEMPAGFSANSDDCNDNDEDANPSGTELCNNKDDDCDGNIDNDITIPEYYADLDEDGYGDPDNATQTCFQPADFVSNNEDCDDGDNGSTHTSIDADCDGIEASQDCDDNDPTTLTLGLGENCPANSCESIINGNPSATDGLYWVLLNNSIQQVVCDMTTDGGGWTVLQHDTSDNIMTGAYGTPSLSSGWSLDYMANGTGVGSVTAKDFYIQIDGVSQGIINDMNLFGQSQRPSLGYIFDGTTYDSWYCDSDNPSSDYCYITDGGGRHWGRWVNNTSGCCLGDSGWWYYSHNDTETLNYGICQQGYPNGSLATGTSSPTGCESSHYTSFSTGGQIIRIAFR